MYSTISITVCILTLVLFSVNADLTCNQTIIDNILKLKSCPTNILQKLHTMSPVTTAVLHETDVQDYMKCSKIMIHAPEDKKANANFTAYFKNEATPPLQVSYRQEEVGCGHINDIYDDGQYQVYFLNVNKAVCIYRCPIAPTKGVATARALVPVANNT
ncbi:uncharacterized protein LOC124374248, partial [Homalodisca vitripennis]|uniref:uncharacterized protein LOC124374248 n=1 Tax=Homalodisca vitripennis TaxID=197043 RepID=UPI001EEC1817